MHFAMRITDAGCLGYFDVSMMFALHSSLKTEVGKKPGFIHLSRRR